MTITDQFHNVGTAADTTISRKSGTLKSRFILAGKNRTDGYHCPLNAAFWHYRWQSTDFQLLLDLPENR